LPKVKEKLKLVLLLLHIMKIRGHTAFGSVQGFDVSGRFGSLRLPNLPLTSMGEPPKAARSTE